MLALVGLAVLVAAPLKLALPEVNAVKVDTKVAAFLGEHLAQQLKAQDLEVLTAREMTSLLGIERQQVLAGCAVESTSCMAELANALGTDGVVLLDLARLGSSIRINLKVLDHTGRTLSTFSAQVGSEDAAADALTGCASRVARETRAALRPGSVAPEVTASSGNGSGQLRRVWWAPAAAGVVAVAIGATLMVIANGAYGQFSMTHQPPLSAMDAQALRSSGQTNDAVGLGLVIGGGVLLALGAVFFLLGGKSE